MSEVAAEVLRLMVGYGETVVALTEGGPARLDRWTCKYWSLRRDHPLAGHEIIIALWLRHVSDGGVDSKTAEYVANTEVYKAIREESEKLGIERGPDMKRLELYIFPAELQVKKVYGNRVVYSLETCRDEVRVNVVKLYQPVWRVCEYGEPHDCQRRRALTESIKSRGVPIEDVVDGVYVPLDVSDLVDLLRRVL
jgi:hypothetical protein